LKFVVCDGFPRTNKDDALWQVIQNTGSPLTIEAENVEDRAEDESLDDDEEDYF
jgi:hypothetical protein